MKTKKIPLNLIIYIILYTIMFALTSYMALWQFTQGFIVFNQYLVIGLALICLFADIMSIIQIIKIKKQTKEGEQNGQK
jgi:hypothetical protein